MKSKRIKGRAGGNAPEYRPPKIAKDNLIATSTAYLVEVISEGPIAGLVDGPRSIYFDQTPLSVLSSSGEQDQFEGVWYIERRGEPEQDYLTGFESIESEFVVNAEATNGYPVVRTINQDVDDIVVKVQIPQLQQVDPKTGDINKFKVQFAIEVAPSGSGNWTTVYDVTLKGKCSSPYQRAYRIENLHQWGPPPWDVRLRRISEDYSPPYKFGETWWASYTLCINEKISYADTAVIGFKIDASKFGSHVPERRYHVKGRIIKVPSNYNPDTREYSGEWDGTFKLAWTNNPAWILYDLLTHPRYGCGINPKFIDKWSLYQIGRYCDELVNSGILKDRIVANSQAQSAGSGKVKIRVENIDRFSVGEKIWIRGTANYNGLKIIDSILNPDSDGYDKIVFSSPYVEETFTNKAAVTYPEPRFTFNYTLQTREDAYKVIAQICSSFRGMAYWSSSAVLFRQDAPSDPIKIVTPANVIGGKFTYESSGTRAQHTVALVTWNDPKNMFKPTIEVVEDLAAIEKYGWNQIDIAAVGCTSRGQARRMGLWALYTERFESEVVTYSASWDHADVLPGDLVKLHDPTQKQAVDGGRIVSCTSTSAILDREPPLESGKTYLVTLVKPDGQLVERTISSWSSNTIYWSQAIQGDLPISGSLWLIAESQYDNATVYRIISVQETEPGIFRISAVRNNPIKYDLIEDFLFDEGMEGVYSRLPAFFPQVKTPPSSLEVSTSWTTVGDSVAPKASVTWVHPEAQFVDKYEVQYSSDTHDWITAGETQENSLDVILDQPGTYRFRVRAVDATPGPWVESSEVQIEYPDPPPQVSNVRVKGGGTSFSEDDCSIEWDSVESDTYGFLYQYVVKVYSTSDVLKRSEVVQGGQTSWVYTRGANEADFGVPTPSFKIGVAAVDIFGQVGPEAKITVSRVQIQPPSNLQTSSDILAVNLSWQAPSSPPAVSHYLIYRHTSNNRSQASLILKVPAPLLRAMDTTATPDLQYYYWIKAVDSWGVESDWNATSGVQGSARRVATADIMDNAIESAKIAAGAVSLTKFASSLRPIQVVSSLPSLPHSDFPQGAVVFLTTENKLYRSTGTTWVASVPTTDLSGQITETQIANDSISTPKIKSNAIEGYHIKSNSISSAHIQSDAIEAGHIKAGAVGTDELAAEAVTAQKIKAGEVYASKLNVAQIFVEALTVSNNSPSSGYVSWTSHTIYYQGTGYSISSGNTNNKYIYWDVGNTTLTASNTKPSWSATRFMIFINDNGLHRLVWNATLIHGGTIVSNSITADEIAANSITVAKLALEARTIFSESFDGTSFDWVEYEGSGAEISIISTSNSVTGGRILQVGNNSGNDGVRLIHSALIPYDPSCVYRIRCRVRKTAGNGRVLIGFAGIGADRVTFVNRFGANTYITQHNWCADNVEPPSEWTLYEGYASGVSYPVSGSGTLASPGTMHPDVRYLRPMICANLVSGSGVAGITQVDMMTVEIIPNQVSMWAHGSDVTKIDGGEIYTGSITANQIAANAITAGKIAAGVVGTNELAADAVTAQKIKAGEVYASKLNVAQIFVDGLSMSNNTPSAGSVSWTSHTIYYQGTAYSISSGSTSDKYIYWDVGNSFLSAASTKPSWSSTRFMIAINDGGYYRIIWNATYIHGGTIVSNSITADEIAANSITVSKLSPEARMVFADTFDGTFDWSKWGVGEITVVSSDDAITGGKILRVGDNSGDDTVYLIHKALIPYDPNCIYRIRVRFRRVAGDGSFYAGFAGVAGDGTTFVNINGQNAHWNQHYHAASGLTSDSWYLAEGYTSGVSSPGQATAGTLTQPGTMHVNTRYLRPAMILNTKVGGTSGITEVDMFAVEIIPNQVSMWAHGSDVTKIDGGEIYTRSITASQIASGTITANEIAAGTITAANIQARSITGDRLVIGTITGNEISANTITGNHIQGGTITGTHIASNTITGNHIQGGTITGTHIAGQTIQTDHLYAKAITTEKINDGAVNTDQVANLAITRANFFDVSDITNFTSTSETTIAQPNVYCKTTNDEVSILFKCHVRMALQSDGKGSYYSVPINFRVKHGSTILDRTSIDTGTLRNTTYIESAYCGLIGIRQPNTVGTVTFTVTAWLNDIPLTGAAAQIKNIKIWVLSKSK